MNNFQKLAQLSRDIELLESAGKFDAAEVLQRKFLKEAQLGIGPAFPQVGRRQPQMGNMQLATNPVPNIAPNYDPMFDGQVSPQGAPYRDYEGEVTKGQMFAQGLGNAAMQQQSQQQPVVQDNFKNYYTEQSDTSNFNQQQNANPNAQQESNEQRLYMNALNDIENAWKQNDRNTAEAIYNKTFNEFKNPKRKDLFGKQIQRVRSKYLSPIYNQGPKQ
jgi:hypothetical protein